MAVNKVIYGGNTLVDLTGDTVLPIWQRESQQQVQTAIRLSG